MLKDTVMCCKVQLTGMTGEVGSTQGMSLLKEKILWLVLMIYVRTMASAHIITVVRSLRVRRNILGAGGHILWLGGR